MRRMISLYLFVVVLLTLGVIGVSRIASAQELRDPMQPPPFALQKFRQARLVNAPKTDKPQATKSSRKPLQLTSILFSRDRKVAIIDDQTLSLGDSINGARLVGLTRESARLVRKGKVINLNLGSDLTTIRKKAVESDL